MVHFRQAPEANTANRKQNKIPVRGICVNRIPRWLGRQSRYKRRACRPTIYGIRLLLTGPVRSSLTYEGADAD